jgi:hypothetical protein
MAQAQASNTRLEKPLILNPCINDFTGEYQYDQFGQILTKNQSARLRTTTQICHLTRSRLRKKRALIIKRTIKFISAIQKYQQTQPAVAQEIRELFRENLLEDNCYFASVARYVNQYPERFGL